MLTYGSTFSGVGGLDIAIEHVFGAEPAWHVEPDPYAAAVLAERWPGVPNFQRIESLNASAGHIDIMCGGFPCQDISLAGEGAGLDGERSGLWWELARAVGALRPAVVVLENVAALASRGLDRVIGELSRLRYDAAWGVLRASDVGAPHRRARMFIVAVDGALSDADRRDLWEVGQREGARRAAERLARGDGESVVDPDRARREQHGQQAQAAAGRGVLAHPGRKDAMALGLGLGQSGQRGGGLLDRQRQALRDDAHRCCEAPRWPPGPGDVEGWARHPGALPGVRRGAYGPPRGVDARRRRERLRCLGNGVVPIQAVEAIGQLWERLVG